MATSERSPRAGVFRCKPIGVSVAVMVLRYRGPDRPRSSGLRGMPVVPIIGIGFSLWLITFLDPVTWPRFAVWFPLGLLVHACYSYRRSALAPRD